MRVASLLGLLLAASAFAAPPPPPPAYVADAAKLLIAKADRDAARLAPLFAPDISAFENGRQVAATRVAWMAWLAADQAHYNGHVIALSEGFGDGNGALLVLDAFDTVDRTHLEPGFLVDPRMATRSTLYQFGADHLIHVVRIATVDGFVMAPPH